MVCHFYPDGKMKNLKVFVWVILLVVFQQFVFSVSAKAKAPTAKGKKTKSKGGTAKSKGNTKGKGELRVNIVFKCWLLTTYKCHSRY